MPYIDTERLATLTARVIGAFGTAAPVGLTLGQNPVTDAMITMAYGTATPQTRPERPLPRHEPEFEAWVEAQFGGPDREIEPP